MFDSIIIGSGIAGLTAATYLGEANKKTLIITGESVGGELTRAGKLTNFPGQPDGDALISDMMSYLESFPSVQFCYDLVVSAQLRGSKKIIVVSDGTTYTAKTIIICTGTTRNLLDLHNDEDLVRTGYLHTCALCDGIAYKGKTVGVVGAGCSAIKEIKYLSEIADHVVSFIRKPEFKIKFEAPSNHTTINLCTIHKVYPKEGKLILETSKGVHTVDGLFCATGGSPNTYLFKDQLDMYPSGRLVTYGVHTSIIGVYSAGDCMNSEKQAVVAAGNGASAGLKVLEFLEVC